MSFCVGFHVKPTAEILVSFCIVIVDLHNFDSWRHFHEPGVGLLLQCTDHSKMLMMFEILHFFEVFYIVAAPSGSSSAAREA